MRRVAHCLRDTRVASDGESGGRSGATGDHPSSGCRLLRREPGLGTHERRIVGELIAISRLGIECEDERAHIRQLAAARLIAIGHPVEARAERPNLVHVLGVHGLGEEVYGAHLAAKRLRPLTCRIERVGVGGVERRLERVGPDEAAREALCLWELELAALLQLTVDKELRERFGEEPGYLMGHADVVPTAGLEGESEIEHLHRRRRTGRAACARRTQLQVRARVHIDTGRQLPVRHALARKDDFESTPLLIMQGEQPRRPQCWRRRVGCAQ